jgi:putative transposase
VADLTAIRTGSGWLYLAAVRDLFSRKIVGWAIAPSMPAAWVGEALRLAIGQRAVGSDLIMHSDRGSQYASELHRDWLERHGIKASMSRQGNGWDNRVMARCFLSLKMASVWHQDDAHQAEAGKGVADDLVGFDNQIRWHAKRRSQSPKAYEHAMAEKELIAVSEIT